MLGNTLAVYIFPGEERRAVLRTEPAMFVEHSPYLFANS